MLTRNKSRISKFDLRYSVTDKILKFVDFPVVGQLIHRPMRAKIS